MLLIISNYIHKSLLLMTLATITVMSSLLPPINLILDFWALLAKGELYVLSKEY